MKSKLCLQLGASAPHDTPFDLKFTSCEVNTWDVRALQTRMLDGGVHTKLGPPQPGPNWGFPRHPYGGLGGIWLAQNVEGAGGTRAPRGQGTAASSDEESRHPRSVQTQFSPTGPNHVWTGDITYIATDEGWLYLAAVIDLFSRQVVGWSIQAHIQSTLVTDALKMAWFRRQPGPAAPL